jgi:hypothetical protein
MYILHLLRYVHPYDFTMDGFFGSRLLERGAWLAVARRTGFYTCMFSKCKRELRYHVRDTEESEVLTVIAPARRDSSSAPMHHHLKPSRTSERGTPKCRTRIQVHTLGEGSQKGPREPLNNDETSQMRRL